MRLPFVLFVVVVVSGCSAFDGGGGQRPEDLPFLAEETQTLGTTATHNMHFELDDGDSLAWRWSACGTMQFTVKRGPQEDRIDVRLETSSDEGSLTADGPELVHLQWRNQSGGTCDLHWTLGTDGRFA